MLMEYNISDMTLKSEGIITRRENQKKKSRTRGYVLIR